MAHSTSRTNQRPPTKLRRVEPEDIAYRAECLRKADMHRLALASVKARAARKGGAGDASTAA
jgi:hypothetical protein